MNGKPSGRQRHVWVRPKFATEDHQGLLLEWQQVEQGWRALVTYWEPEGERAVTSWFPADQVRPAAPSS